MQSLRKHDLYQEVTEEERWTVPSENIIPGKSVFTINAKAQSRFELSVAEIFKRTLVRSLYCKRECDIFQSCHVDCRYVWMVLERKRCMCLEGRENILKPSCADLVLWIIVWLGAESGQLFVDDQGQALGHVSDVLKSWGMSDV